MRRPAAKLGAEEKSALLAAWHPDNKVGGMTNLLVGPSAGQPCPVDLATLLHANALATTWTSPAPRRWTRMCW
jgi:hypothetical protein